MLRNELLKTGISGAVGLILSFFLLETFGWPILLLLPLYAIGTVYVIRHVLRILGAIMTWFFSLLGIAVGTFNVFGCLFGLLMCLIAILATLSFAWIPGLIVCIVEIVRAASSDASFSRPAASAPAGNTQTQLPWRQKKSLPGGTGNSGTGGSGSNSDDPWGLDF